MDNFLSHQKAAKMIGVTNKTLRSYREKGYFSAIELQNLVLIPLHEVKDFREKYRDPDTRKAMKKSPVALRSAFA